MFSFENQGTSTYLVYTVQENDSIDTMSLGMLMNNKIPGLATALFTQRDEEKYIKYNVTAKVSAKQFFAGSVNRKRLLGVFNGILDAMISAEDYMIDVNSILLDLNYIFADVSNCETILICLPIHRSEAKTTDLGMFFKEIMFGTQFDQTENCDYIPKIINYLNSSPIFMLQEFKSVLNDIERSGQSNPMKETVIVQKQQPIETKPQEIPQTVAPAPQPVVKPVVQPTIPQAPQSELVKKPAKVATKAPNQVPPQAPPTTQMQEKKMGMFNLLMHYSKENVEIYKAQKAAEKQVPKETKAKPVNPSKQAISVPGGNASQFDIPGQESKVPTAPVQIPKPQPSVQPVVNNTPSQAAAVNQPAFTPQPEIRQGQPMNFGETTVLGGNNIGETTVLSGELNPQQRPMPHLIREKNNEKVILDKPVFRIGKERSYVDYFISDNTAVSRSHANIVVRDECYYLMDTNSTNHTFLNGMMIQSNVEMKLEHGDKIRLANEGFEFKLY